MKTRSAADHIREYVKEQFLEKAQHQGLTSIRIVAGEVHKGLGLRNQVPNVCQVLRSRKFLNENQLVLEKFEGPPSGLGTTATFTYRLTANRGPASEKEPFLLSLRGIAKDTFASLGGGETFIRSERENFHRREEDR